MWSLGCKGIPAPVPSPYTYGSLHDADDVAGRAVDGGRCRVVVTSGIYKREMHKVSDCRDCVPCIVLPPSTVLSARCSRAALPESESIEFQPHNLFVFVYSSKRYTLSHPRFLSLPSGHRLFELTKIMFPVHILRVRHSTVTWSRLES